MSQSFAITSIYAQDGKKSDPYVQEIWDESLLVKGNDTICK